MKSLIKDIIIVLIKPSTSGNVGAIARSMANFGFKKLVLVNPSCDKDDDEARNRAKHAQKILDNAKIINTFEEVLELADVIAATSGTTGVDYNVPRSPLLPAEFCSQLADISGSIAIVFGTESDGLSNEQIQKCDFLINIPTSKEYPIMNLSHAVNIILYELSKQKLENEVRDIHPLANQKDKEILLSIVDELMAQTDFSTQDEEETQRKVWKRLIGKGMLTRREAFALMGFLKKLKK